MKTELDDLKKRFAQRLEADANYTFSEKEKIEEYRRVKFESATQESMNEHVKGIIHRLRAQITKNWSNSQSGRQNNTKLQL
eukprot:TRINITY_DN3241_c0_g1_i1.p2 TRINITY_DN3241_c0_g1~~TRINITY_DN3241_c0_g1_i1.p2  ORF type:complete len:81 (-),score=15.53 TRINITY_DN3241_c0_g1_i1:104-346(-)